MKKKFLISTGVIFVLLSVAFYVLRYYAPDFQFGTLEAGNIIMAGLAFVTYLLVTKQIDNRPQAFVRGVYSASFLKLMVCMISILVYVLLNRAHIHKPSVFVLFGIYVVYSVMEATILSKIVKEQNN